MKLDLVGCVLVQYFFDILLSCTEAKFTLKQSANITTNWCAIDKSNQVVEAEIAEDSTNYSYDAMRTLWRIALDYKWFGDGWALNYLKNMSIWPQEWEDNKTIYASYTHDGKALGNSESLAHYGNQLAQFSITNKDIAKQIYDKKFIRNGAMRATGATKITTMTKAGFGLGLLSTLTIFQICGIGRFLHLTDFTFSLLVPDLIRNSE